MRFSTGMLTGLLLAGSATFAFANPATLPDHPGYPSKGEFSHDTGRQNLTAEQSLLEAATSGNGYTDQMVADQYKSELKKMQGTGQSSMTHGASSKKMERPAGEATPKSKKQ